MTNDPKPIGQFTVRKVEGPQEPKKPDELEKTASSVDAFFHSHNKETSDGFWKTWEDWKVSEKREIKWHEKAVSFFPALYHYYTGKKEETTFTLTPESGASLGKLEATKSGDACLVSGIIEGYSVRILAYDEFDQLIDLDPEKLNTPIVLALLQKITDGCRSNAKADEEVNKMKVTLSYESGTPSVKITGITGPSSDKEILDHWKRVRLLLSTHSLHIDIK